MVDDDEELRELLHTELELAGFYVFTAHNGAVGVEKAKTQKPDVILMDVLMPEMNGFEATKILKRDENTKYIPIIMVTAEGKKEHIITGLEAGAIDYVTKPFFLPELKARVKSVLRFKKIYSDLASINEEVIKKETSLKLRETTNIVNRTIDDNFAVISGRLKDIYQHHRYLSDEDMRIIKDSMSNIRNTTSQLSMLDTLVFRIYQKVSDITSGAR